MTLARILWTVGGCVFLVVGIAGVILPLLPGTVFLLAASACFLRGSERFHRWLNEHRILGPHVRAIREGRGMPLRARVITLVAMWGAIAVALSRLDVLALELFLVVLAMIGTAFITMPRLMKILQRRAHSV